MINSRGVIEHVENIDKEIINLLRRRVAISQELIKRPEFLLHHKNLLNKMYNDLERIEDAAKHERRFLRKVYKKMMKEYKRLLRKTKSMQYKI